jgi:hypothetical protein
LNEQKNIPFNFVFDYLVPLEVIVKSMFGMFALYTNEKIILMLRQRKEDLGLNGVWIATSQEHHKSLKNDIPSLRAVSPVSDSLAETGWQLIPHESSDFEKSVIKACELIKHGDRRIGKIPIPRKKKANSRSLR